MLHCKIMKFKGLTNNEVLKSREQNGTNQLTQLEQDPIWKKVLEGFKDPMIMILLVALAIQIVFCFLGKAEWYEAVGILIAVLIANLVGVLSENSQENKAAALRAEEQAKEKTKVIRDGSLIEIPVNDVVVGDIVLLESGDKVPADGIILDGEVKVDQASLNGESEEAKKVAVTDKNKYIAENSLGTDLLMESYAFRGTVICNGSCYMEVLEVGDKSTYGKLALEMQEDTRETPLKVKLNKLAGQISKFGYIGATVIALAYLVDNLWLAGNMPVDVFGWVNLLLNAISLAVVIVCMAVPEGLPMMISMVLSMNMGKMMKDNVLVHKLNGIETAGGLNILFSDKTGTITKGQLSVVEVTDGSLKAFKKLSEMPNEMKSKFLVGVGVNNSASISNDKVIGGNSTDRALMNFVLESDIHEINKAEVLEFNAFDSNKKCSSVIISKGDKHTTYIKGAAEKIIARCTSAMSNDGSISKLSEKDFDNYNKYMDEQASRSMRLLAVAITDGNNTDSNDLTLIGIISIRDDVRPEARDAIADVKAAGVQVIMATGDRLETAVAIAKEASLLSVDNSEILTPENKNDVLKKCQKNKSTELSLTSNTLAELTDDEIKSFIPYIRVIARALPTDKSRLVKIAQELDLVCGMTGDGVNDAPALKKADVGFAMGSGTEVAKEAGDITILDDNFASIQKAILYGRTIFTNIRKFLIFQLSVNVTTVLLCFLAPLLGIAQPFSIVSILAINLVMDTLAAIAFGCEPALKRYMKDAPIKRSESIINKYMATQIGTTAIFSTVIGLLILLNTSLQSVYAPGVTDLSEAYRESALMAFFMLTIIFTGFNARSTNANIFEHMNENKPFSLIMAGVLAMVFVLIHIVSTVAGLTPITGRTWLVMLGLAILIVPIDMIRKVIVNKK